MTVVSTTRGTTVNAALPCATHDHFRLTGNLTWWDADTDCSIVLSQPALDPSLWAEYGHGAELSYRRHGVECALDHDALSGGADTIMFFAVVDGAGIMVAGVRAKGPLRAADESHAVLEWQDQPGQPAVRKMITDRLPYGVLEMKSAWVTDDPHRCGSLTDAVARSGFHMMALLPAQFCMATAAGYVLNRWRSSGGVLAPIPAAPYPDRRYQTKMMWWDRRTFTRHARPDQAAKIIGETLDITRALNTEALGWQGSRDGSAG
jgi:hypothetical protein